MSLFRRFLALVASRHGQILNKTDFAAPLGLSVPSVARWLDILETTAQILVVPPYFTNLGKRLVKSPKVYIADSGLACHLLGIDTERELAKSPFRGPLFEGFVASEIVKAQVHSGRRREIYYFRDRQGLEVDFVVPAKDGGAQLVEAKASSTVTPDMAEPMLRLAKAWKRGSRMRGELSMHLVHFTPRAGVVTRAIAPGVQAIAWQEFVRGFDVFQRRARKS